VPLKTLSDYWNHQRLREMKYIGFKHQREKKQNSDNRILKNCTFKSLITWAHITLSVISQLYLFSVFGSDYQFFID
jgi:hypothetical protein